MPNRVENDRFDLSKYNHSPTVFKKTGTSVTHDNDNFTIDKGGIGDMGGFNDEIFGIVFHFFKKKDTSFSKIQFIFN